MSIFDGMAGVLNGVFGAPVTVTPEGEAAVEIRGVFRENPVTVPDADGREVLSVLPVLSVPRNVAETLASGTVVNPGNGRTYSVVNSLPSGSPAGDGFINYELEEISP
ncbi:MAG: hypothetical protein VX874_15875 [Pseudomonadota bacterium]|nr:hypothetical protein [Pseudomonadota bacterium]